MGFNLNITTAQFHTPFFFLLFGHSTIDSRRVSSMLFQFCSDTLNQLIRVDWLSYLEASLAKEAENDYENPRTPELYLKLTYVSVIAIFYLVVN